MFFIDPSSKDIGRSCSSAPYYFTPSVRAGIGIEEEDFMLSPNSNSENFSFHLLEKNSPLISDYWRLRKRIFCEEQNIFTKSDIDEIDQFAYPIVSLNYGYGSKESIVGVVRIYETEKRHRYGGRLGVDSVFRKFNQIGKGLIWKAVTTANGWGCDQFLATVQIQNVSFFRRLKWNSIKQIEIKGIKHHLMEADLDYYKPSNLIRPSSHLVRN